MPTPALANKFINSTKKNEKLPFFNFISTLVENIVYQSHDCLNGSSRKQIVIFGENCAKNVFAGKTKIVPVNHGEKFTVCRYIFNSRHILLYSTVVMLI